MCKNKCEVCKCKNQGLKDAIKESKNPVKRINEEKCCVMVANLNLDGR